MPANYNDTPSTYEENLEYLRDPTSPRAKEYSTAQKAANAENRTRQWLYHPKEPKGKIFSKDEVAAKLKEGWSDHRIPEGEETVVEVNKTIPGDSYEREVLFQEAESMGIQVDKRWSTKKLRETILKAAPGA